MHLILIIFHTDDTIILFILFDENIKFTDKDNMLSMRNLRLLHFQFLCQHERNRIFLLEKLSKGID